MKFILNRDTELSTTLLKKILEKHRAHKANLERLHDYYCGKHDILNRSNQDKTKPNHKIVNPFPQYITDTLCGYFVGEPITYSSMDENAHNELNAILNYNDVAAVDMANARDMSIFGKSYELHYIDADGITRFTNVSAENMIIVYDDTIEAEILYAVRLVPNYDIMKDKTVYKVEVYSNESVRFYDSNEDLSALTLTSEAPHYFGLVPVCEFLNNEEEIGDFETVIPLIDAYDMLESDALNDFDYFVDAYLVLTGMTADAEDISKMKENRVILLDDADAKAEWLIKSENDTVSQNLKDRFKNDIHKFSKTPDLSDEAFSNNASGVAIKYKLYGTESLASNKERFFKKGLQRRIELIFNILNMKGGSYDYRGVDIVFTRNIPTNANELADMVQKLSGVVSTETLLAQLPFVEDVKKEMEKREEEHANSPFYDLDFELGGNN